MENLQEAIRSFLKRLHPAIATMIYLMITAGILYLLLNDPEIREYYEWKARLCPWCM